MFNPKDIVDILASNVKNTRNPFGDKKRKINKWHRRLNLKSKGEYLLFTGLMYQMVPYIEATVFQLERLEGGRLQGLVKWGKCIPASFNLFFLEMISSRREKKRASLILRNIATLLGKSNVDFFYQEDLDDYSGILLYDLGDVESFADHARYVASKLRSNKINKIVTVDPHTTYALKVLYPKYTGETFEVKTYLELLDFDQESSPRKIILHDPCFYGRYLHLSHVPRNILKRVNVEIEETFQYGTFTHCCGGPAESISPKLSKEIREKRIAQLEKNRLPIVTMCPIGYSN